MIDTRPYIGRTFDQLPCLVLVLRVMNEQLGHEIPDPGTAPGEVPPAEWYRHWHGVVLGQERAGDVLEAAGGERSARTVGVLLETGRVLTSHHELGVCVLHRRAFAPGGVLAAWRPA